MRNVQISGEVGLYDDEGELFVNGVEVERDDQSALFMFLSHPK